MRLVVGTVIVALILSAHISYAAQSSHAVPAEIQRREFQTIAPLALSRPKAVSKRGGVNRPSIRRYAGYSGLTAVRIPVTQNSYIEHQLNQILSAPEYNRVYAQPDQSNFARQILDKLGKLIQDFIAWMRDSLALKGDSAGRVASFIFAGLVLIGFAALLVLLVRKLLRSGRSGESLEPSYAPDSVYGLPSAKPLIREAAMLAEAGDYRGAFRCAYMASISHLDEVQALRFQRGRTNWEYLRDLRHGGHEQPHEVLRRITSTFDRKFYGRETCDRNDYLDALAVYERISSEAAA